MKKLCLALFLLPFAAIAQIPDYSRIQAPIGPNIVVSPLTMTFVDTSGSPSQSQPAAYGFNALTGGNGAISLPTWAEGSTDNGLTWHGSFSSLVSGIGTLLVRVKSGNSNGSYGPSAVAFTATGATTVNLMISATVVPVPSLSASPTSLSVTGTVGSSGTPASTIVTFANTSATATAPTNTEVSVDGGGSYGSSKNFSSGSPLSVRLRTTSSAPVGSISGLLKFTGTGISEFDVTVSGAVSSSGSKDTVYVNMDTTETITATHWVNTNHDPSKQNLRYIIANPHSGNDTLNIVAANWVEYTGGSCNCSAYPDNGYTSATFAPLQVVKECWFSYNGNGSSDLDPYTHGVYKMWIGGLNPSSTYKFILSGTLNGSVFNFSSSTEYRIEGASLTGPETVNCFNNTTTVTSTFNTISPDASGRVYIYVNAAHLQEMGVTTMLQWTEN